MQVDAPYVTIDEYLSYGLSQVEVAGGQMVFSAAPTGEPPRVITRLTRRLDRFVMHGRLGDLAMGDSFILDGDPAAGQVRFARRCDLAFIAQPRIEALPTRPGRDAPWWLPPDVVIEVTEQDEWPDSLDERVAEYLRFGVARVWVIDVPAREVRDFSPADQDGEILAGTDTLNGDPVIPGWSVKVEDIFGR